MIAFLVVGCDVRDEVVHTPQSTHNRWPEPVTYRIDQNDTQLATMVQHEFLLLKIVISACV